MRTYKQIEQSRNTRLWIAQIIVPAAVGAITLAANPSVQRGFNRLKKFVVDKIKSIKIKKTGVKH